MARTTGTRRGAAVGAISLLSLTLAGVEPATAEPFVEVNRAGSKFSVDASGVNVTTVLLALGREAGFGVEDTRPDVDRPIDIAVSGATLDQALRRVLERYNHLIVYRNGSAADHGEPDAVARVILLGPRTGTTGAERSGVNRNVSPLAGPGATAARPPAPRAAPPAPAPAPAPVPAEGDPAGAMGAPAAVGFEPPMPAGAETIALRHARALEEAGAITTGTMMDRLPGELEAPLPEPEADYPLGD